MEPVSPIFSVINNVKNVIEYGFQLAGVSEESRNAQRLLTIVQGDLNELKRLATELKDTIRPDEQRNVDRIICETNEVIALMAAPNKRSREDVRKHGTITIYRRILWTLRDGKTIKEYNYRLLACQTSLNGQLTRLGQRARPIGREDGSSLASDSGAGGASGLQRGLHSRSEAILIDDLDDKSFWEDWIGAGSHPSTTGQEQDFTWLGEHTESELGGQSHEYDIPAISEPQDNLSWLAEGFNKAEEDDRKHRSVSRH